MVGRPPVPRRGEPVIVSKDLHNLLTELAAFKEETPARVISTQGRLRELASFLLGKGMSTREVKAIFKEIAKALGWKEPQSG